jgi:hypothetical protein
MHSERYIDLRPADALLSIFAWMIWLSLILIYVTWSLVVNGIATLPHALFMISIAYVLFALVLRILLDLAVWYKKAHPEK